ncbi:DUF4430 domain-containing protein [Paludibacter jiangxiensis]|uniref:Transcobalamin-like C-terminal domain-containing protein n=1 Tax=Paludibacter jiangxiensis TaxID=681398 RepID=A0A161LX48_9BACT|nr:DUF4430 domain-containing protein [Paludibacter jiangxiensis]GAT63972.1 hypothetical protein PJIAN_4515 [Paludibacter jiangxiensis]
MRAKIYILFFLLLVMPAVSFGGNNKVQQTKKEITVEIDYGKAQSPKTVKVAWFPGIAVLGALQEAAETETHPVGSYVFVTAIDQVKGERGKMAWYYRINGKAPKKLALYQMLKPGDTVSWRYVEDVCSWKVDNPSKGQ